MSLHLYTLAVGHQIKAYDITMPATVNCIYMKSLITVTYTGVLGEVQKGGREGGEKRCMQCVCRCWGSNPGPTMCWGESQAARHFSCLNN